MLAILGLFGIALAASAFVDVSDNYSDDDADFLGPEDDLVADDDMVQSFLGGAEGVSDSMGAGQDAPDMDSGGVLADSHDAPDTDPAADDFDSVGINFLGSGVDDYAEGTDNMDAMEGGDGNDSLHGGRGDDFMLGGAGDDDLIGATGDDELFGEAGDDDLLGGDGHDRLYGGDGDDRLNGSYGDDTLLGGDGADQLQGGAGNDILHGGEDTLRDFLNGGDGDDTLVAGSNDNLNGGNGADSFVLADVSDVTIDDFNPEEDIIELAYDTTPPDLTTVQSDFGITLLADGEVIAAFPGLDALDVTKSVSLIKAA